MANEEVKRLVRQGIAAARAGRREEAQRLLAQAVAEDPADTTAWLWLAGVVDDPRRSIACLERVLILDPDNPYARRGLQWARARSTAYARLGARVFRRLPRGSEGRERTSAELPGWVPPPESGESGSVERELISSSPSPPARPAREFPWHLIPWLLVLFVLLLFLLAWLVWGGVFAL